MNPDFPLLEDEIEVEITSYDYLTGKCGYRVISGKSSIQVAVCNVQNRPMQPALVELWVKSEDPKREWRFHLAVGCCKRLINSDRPIPNSILYQLN